MTLTFIGIIAAAIIFLIKPLLINKLIRRPTTRPMIIMAALVILVVSMMGYGSVMTATEPASIKEARIAQQEQERKAKEDAEAQRKIEEEAKRPVIKTETEKQAIPFKSVTQDDNTLEKGKTRTAVEGMEGERSITYEVTYTQGIETARKEIGRSTVKEPVNEVTQVGTYVAPVYTPAPTPQYQAQSSGGRVGAICNDGRQSSATGRGACSHHGGVSYWLYE